MPNDICPIQYVHNLTTMGKAVQANALWRYTIDNQGKVIGIKWYQFWKADYWKAPYRWASSRINPDWSQRRFIEIRSTFKMTKTIPPEHYKALRVANQILQKAGLNNAVISFIKSKWDEVDAIAIDGVIGKLKRHPEECLTDQEFETVCTFVQTFNELQDAEAIRILNQLGAQLSEIDKAKIDLSLFELKFPLSGELATLVNQVLNTQPAIFFPGVSSHDELCFILSPHNVANLRRLVGANPNRPLVWFKLGKATQDSAEKQRAFERAHELEPKNITYLRALVEVFPSIEAYRKLLALDPQQQQDWEHLWILEAQQLSLIPEQGASLPLQLSDYYRQEYRGYFPNTRMANDYIRQAFLLYPSNLAIKQAYLGLIPGAMKAEEALNHILQSSLPPHLKIERLREIHASKAFLVEDFTNHELGTIMTNLLARQPVEATPAQKAAITQLLFSDFRPPNSDVQTVEDLQNLFGLAQFFFPEIGHDATKIPVQEVNAYLDRVMGIKHPRPDDRRDRFSFPKFAHWVYHSENAHDVSYGPFNLGCESPVKTDNFFSAAIVDLKRSESYKGGIESPLFQKCPLSPELGFDSEEYVKYFQKVIQYAREHPELWSAYEDLLKDQKIELDPAIGSLLNIKNDREDEHIATLMYGALCILPPVEKTIAACVLASISQATAGKIMQQMVNMGSQGYLHLHLHNKDIVESLNHSTELTYIDSNFKTIGLQGRLDYILINTNERPLPKAIGSFELKVSQNLHVNQENKVESTVVIDMYKDMRFNLLSYPFLEALIPPSAG